MAPDAITTSTPLSEAIDLTAARIDTDGVGGTECRVVTTGFESCSRKVVRWSS